MTPAQKPPAAGVPWSSPSFPVALIPVNGTEEKAKKTTNNSTSSSRSAAGGGGGSDAVYAATAAAAAAATAGGSPGPDQSSYRNLDEARVALQAMYDLMAAGESELGAV